MTTKTRRDGLHRLVDELPEGELHSARRFLESLRGAGDPVLRSLMEAPEDDEELTEEEKEAIDEAWQDYLRGDVISSEDAKRELLS